PLELPEQPLLEVAGLGVEEGGVGVVEQLAVGVADLEEVLPVVEGETPQKAVEGEVAGLSLLLALLDVDDLARVGDDEVVGLVVGGQRDRRVTPDLEPAHDRLSHRSTIWGHGTPARRSGRGCCGTQSPRREGSMTHREGPTGPEERCPEWCPESLKNP